MIWDLPIHIYGCTCMNGHVTCVLYHRFTYAAWSSSRFGNAFCVTDVWSPYTHVVNLYRRTRHLLLRFLCLTGRSGHTALRCCDFLAQKYHISETDYPFALRRLPTVELCSPCGEVPWNIAVVNRRARDSSLAMTHTVSVWNVWGFRMHARRFMGFQNAHFVRISIS